MSKLDKENEKIDKEYQALLEEMAEEGIISPTAQQIHDYQMLKIPDDWKPDPGSRQKLEALLKQKEKSSKAESPSGKRDLYAVWKERYPGLTTEQIDEMVKAAGF